MPTLQAVCRVFDIPRPDLARGCLLPAHAGAGATARAFTGLTLDDWDRTPLVDDVASVAAELFTNALRHGHGSWPDAGCSRSIRFALAAGPAAVMCLVSDPGPGIPLMRQPDARQESGRGLHIVDALATSWGYLPAGADGPGKTVWALFAAGDPAPAPHLGQ
jgi:hypothetical protein